MSGCCDRWEKENIRLRAALVEKSRDLEIAHRVVEAKDAEVKNAVRIGCENITAREKAEASLALANKRLAYFDAWKPADSPDIQEAVIAKLNLVSADSLAELRKRMETGLGYFSCPDCSCSLFRMKGPHIDDIIECKHCGWYGTRALGETSRFLASPPSPAEFRTDVDASGKEEPSLPPRNRPACSPSASDSALLAAQAQEIKTLREARDALLAKAGWPGLVTLYQNQIIDLEASLAELRKRMEVARLALEKAEHGLILTHNLEASDDTESGFLNTFVIDNGAEMKAVEEALALIGRSSGPGPDHVDKETVCGVDEPCHCPMFGLADHSQKPAPVESKPCCLQVQAGIAPGHSLDCQAPVESKPKEGA